MFLTIASPSHGLRNNYAFSLLKYYDQNAKDWRSQNKLDEEHMAETHW